MKASIIIPNWNGQPLLKECLDSLKLQTFKDFEVIIVDNGSTDDSISYLKTNYPSIKVIKLDKNYGFATAINAGVRSSKSEYIVMLNNDTAVDKNWLKELVKSADKHPEVISVGSKILNYYNRNMFDGIGININDVGQGISLGWKEKDNGQYEEEFYIFGATGGAALFRRKEFIKLGLFDQDYFMYYEEVDFAFRAQFKGYKSVYCPKAIVYHKHKASSNKRPQHLEFWFFKNMTQNIIKNFPTGILLKDYRWLKIILVHFNTIFYQIKNGFYWPPLAVEWWLLTNLPRLLKKRSVIQKSRKILDDELELFLSEKKISFWRLRKI